MAQVVSSENLVEVMQNGGRAPEFKAPEAAKPADAGKDPGKIPDQSGTTVQPRKSDGTFDSPSGEKPSEKGKAAPQPAESDDGLRRRQRIDDLQKELLELDPDGEILNSHAQRVIGKKHRSVKEAETFARERDADAAAERVRAASLQRELEELKGKKSGQGPATGDDSDNEPKPEDFKTVGEYTRALTKYEVAKAAKAAGEANARQSAEDRQKAEFEEIRVAFTDRCTEFEKTHPDYETVIESSKLELADAGLQYLAESEYGPHISYFLASSEGQEFAERLSQIKTQPRKTIAELGKLEASKPWEKSATPKQDAPPPANRQVSRAPAPIQPLNADAATPVQKDPAQMSFQELRAHREAERRAGKRM